MGTLRVQLLGVVCITHKGSSSRTSICRSAMGLLAYLILFRRRIHSREILAEVFWGNHSEDRARSCLNTTLWRLRKALEPEGIPRGTYLVTTSTGEVGFNRESNYWLDVAILENQAKKILSKHYQELKAEDVYQLEGALKLYTGDLLEGFYDDWTLGERERLRLLYLKSQAHLLGYYSYKGSYEKSLACGQNILAIDPLREEIHREMMRLYMDSGQRALAIRQYETCHRVLETELGIAPMEETQTLRNQIIQGNGQDLSLTRKHGDFKLIHSALEQLQLGLRNLNNAAEQIRQASSQLEQIL